MARSDAVTLLDWDTRQFGFRVGRAADGASAAETFERAAALAVRLIYWVRNPAGEPPVDCRGRYYTQLADRRVDYARDLPDVTDETRGAGMTLRPFPRAPASPSLVQLAIESGRCSRFRRDANFPPGIFEGLYQIWIDRSTRGEIADATIVASSTVESDEVLGMATVSIAGAEGRVGLIAVSEAARGKGLGAALMHAAHRHMARRGCRTALVATQRDNLAACGLYRRCGYTIAESVDVYHSWLAAA